MQRLIAHPDKRVRASRFLNGTEELALPIIGEARNGAVRRILMFLSMLGLSFAAVLVVVGGGREVWLDKAERGVTQFLVTISNEFGLVVKTITISGNDTVTSEIFEDTLGIRVGDPMALADLGGALARLNKLEWVDQVGVSRNWPNEIIVDVREKMPVAVWESPDGRVLIDRDGYSCGNRYIDRYSNLPILTGMGAQEAFPRLLRILNTNSIVKSSVERAVLVGSRRWDLKMKGNILVRLPEVAVEKAWAKFTEHFEKDYLSLVGATVADYTLGDRLILVLDINSGGESRDNLVRRPTLEIIIKADQNQASHEIVPLKPI